MPWLRRCVYGGHQCAVVTEYPDGTIRIASDDYAFASTSGGWERTDKFLWEKLVQRADCCMLDEDQAGHADDGE